MAALPVGWTEVALAPVTHSLDCAVALRAQVPAGPVNFAGMASAIDDAYLQTRIAGAYLGCGGLGAGINSYATVETILAGYWNGGVYTETVLNSGVGSCTPGLLPSVLLVRTIANLRLGVKVTSGGVLTYEWFTDASTVYTVSMGGFTVFTRTYSDPPQPYGLDNRVSFGLFATAPTTSVNSQAVFDTFRFQGVSLGLGSFAYTHPISSPVRFFGPPWEWKVDLAAIDETGAGIAVDATYDGPRVTPTVVTHTENMPTGGFPVTITAKAVTAAVLADPWLSAQTIVPYVADRTFQFEGMSPRVPGNTSPTDWSVGSITIASPLSVLLGTNAWSTTLGSVTIGGTSTVPTFTVTAGPATVRRIFREHWRNWNASADPLYQPTDNYTATKRSAYGTGATTPDVWAWGLYAYLDVDMTVPTLGGGPQDLAFAVTFAVIREGGGIDTIERTYSPVTFPDGIRSTQRIDLLFPTEFEGRPFYGERADSIRIIGLQVGTAYTLHSLSLVAAEQAYVTLAGRSHTLRDFTSRVTGVVLSQDGSCAMVNWGRDTALSPLGDSDLDGHNDRGGDHQNGLVLVDTLAYEVHGWAPGMLAGTLADTFTELHRMEGVTAVYSASAMDTAFTDSYGALLGVTRGCTWFKPTVPHARITAGTPYDVRGQVVVTGVTIPSGLAAAQMVIFQRVRLGMTLEALATDDAFNRIGSGFTVTARAYTGGAPTPGDTLLATAVTDASGMVTLPIRVGTLAGLNFSAYLSGS